MTEKKTTHLKVDKKIISLLSKSTYTKSFSNAIRELVSNSYDADARTVNINIDKSLKNITIEDDGNGMTFDEFDHYCTIAGQKREIVNTRKYKRKRIGQFGIGFLSIFPFCESFEITSTVENSTNVLKAVIPAVDYFDNKDDIEIQDIKINVGISTNNALKSEHFTKIKLNNPTFHFKQYFTKEKSSKRDSIIVWDPFEKFKWELKDNLPIAYESNSIFFNTLKYEEPIELNVFLNNEQLFRNSPQNHILHQEKGSIEDIKYQIVIATNYSSIKPQELRGIKIRINNVGLGERTDFGLKRDRGFSRLHWLNGEVMLYGQVKKYLNINRDNLLDEPVIKDLIDKLGEILKKYAYYIESVDTAAKRIKNALANTKTVSDVRSKNEIIKSNLKLLENRGFKIEEASENVKSIARKMKDIMNPIVIDKVKKTVTILNPEGYDKDEEIILNKKYELQYLNNFKNETLPCKMIDGSTIAINEKYPLFQSRQYGYLFKKIHLFLLISQHNSSSVKEMYSKIIENFLEEFKNY